jgi:molybdopterin-guanine dinucleotide biosynthesis protein A
VSVYIPYQEIWNEEKFEKVFIISVDTPNITKETIQNIIKQSNNYDITIAKTKDNKTHNLIGVFTQNIKLTINDMLKNNNHKINFLVKNVKSNIVKDFDNSEFINLNTKKDYLIFKFKSEDFYIVV